MDEIWCTWEPEAARLAVISGNGHVIVVPNAIPASSISPSRLPDRPIVGFTGTYAHTPTLDAAIVLVDDVLPLLRVLAPDVRVRLAGTGMPTGIEQRLSLTPEVAVMVVAPRATPVTLPLLAPTSFTVAAEGTDDVQLAEVVMSALLRSV